MMFEAVCGCMRIFQAVCGVGVGVYRGLYASCQSVSRVRVSRVCEVDDGVW